MPGISPISIYPVVGKRGGSGTPIPPPPYVIADMTLLTAPSYEEGMGPGASSSTFRVLADGIGSNVTVTPSANFEVSSDGVSWSTSLMVNYPGGTFASASIYRTRLKAGLTLNAYSGTITLSATGATNFVINVYSQVTPSSYDASTLLYLSYLTGSISTPWKNAVNNLVVSYKASGIWSKLDAMWIHCTENQQNARINLKNPSSTPIVEVAAPAWTINRGYESNGTTSYLNLKYNPRTQGINFGLNSNAYGFSRSAATILQGAGIGGYSADGPGDVFDIMTTTGGGMSIYNNNGSFINGPGPGGTVYTGLFSASRTSSSDVWQYTNNSTGTNFSSQSTGNNAVNTCNDEMFGLVWGLGGTPIFNVNGSGLVNMHYTAGSLSQIEHLSFYNSWAAFIAAIGFNI